MQVGVKNYDRKIVKSNVCVSCYRGGKHVFDVVKLMNGRYNIVSVKGIVVFNNIDWAQSEKFVAKFNKKIVRFGK